MSDPRQGRPSASAIERRFLCPGSANAERGLVEPEVDAKDVKDDGIQIHAALAGDTDALLKLSSANLTVYEEMRDKAAGIVAEFGFDPNRFHAEQRVWMNDEFSGQPDRVYIDGVRSLCIDFKSGFLPVTTASENPQLATLAVLVIKNYAVAKVTVAIIPRFGRIKETAVYDLSSAQSALEHIRFIIAESEKPDAPRRAGDKQCRYCLASTRCPEYLAFASTALAVKESTLPSIPADQLALAIDRISAALNLIDALKAEGKRRLAEGDPEFSKLYELTKGRRQRDITDLPELFNRARAMGVTDAEFTAQCAIDFGAVDKDGSGSGLKFLIHQKTGLKGTALNQKADELLTGIVKVSRTAGSLKRRET